MVLNVTRPAQPPLKIRERIWQVDTVQVEPTRLSPTLTLYGKVGSPNLMKASAPGKSRVHRVLAKDGQRIQEGQLLLELDPRDFKPKVTQTAAQIAELEAEIISDKLRYASDKKAYKYENALLKLSQAGVHRATQMKEKNLGSAAALDEALENVQRQSLAVINRKLQMDDHKARLQQLRARLNRASADNELALLDLERSQVHAPFPGYVAEVNVASGDQVDVGQLLLRLYPLDGLEVRAKIPAPYQGEFQTAIAEQFHLEARARIAGVALILELDRLSGMADSRGIDALFRIREGSDKLRLGSSLSLHLQRLPRPNAVAIPYSAVYGSSRVYKFVEGRMQGLDVIKVGDYIDAAGSTYLLVTSPMLKRNDRIIVTHLPNAMTGLRVTINKTTKNTAGS